MSLKPERKWLSRLFGKSARHEQKRTRALLSETLHALDRGHEIAWLRHLAALRASAAGDNPLLRFGQKVFSQNDEDGIIEAIWERIAPGRTGCFLEFGVGDGTENNTLNLLVKGWRGAWFGCEELKAAPDADRVRFTKGWLDRENIVSLAQDALKAMGIAQPDLVSLDLDGNDWHFVKVLLEAGIAPRVFIVEYNASFTPSTRWVMPYDPAHRWDGTAYFGASLGAFCALFEVHGYRLVCCNLNGINAFFVKQELGPLFQEVPLDPARIFMPPLFRRHYPYAGHPLDRRLIEAASAQPLWTR